jgi:hypothetical protein
LLNSKSVFCFQEYHISSNNKTNRHDLTDILLKVALNTINQQIPPTIYFAYRRISGVMVSVLAASATDRGFETRVYYYDRQYKELRVSEWVIVVKLQIGILFSGISWREHVTFIDMMMSTLY